MNQVPQQHVALPVSQRGAVVLMLMIILTISTATYFLVQELNNTRLQAARDKTNAAVLAQAKEAILGFALANNDMPGGLPFPDRREAATPNYDGNGDCVTVGFSNDHLLGKFPFLYDQGCGLDTRAFDIYALDASGERLWYAASANLVKSTGGHFPVPTNSSTIMLSSGWLTVSDGSGAVLSNQVAFVLIAPGEVLSGQNRAGIAPNAKNYLDSFTVGANTYSNWQGTSSALGFIMARPVNNGANRFNDRLLYVTRDELVNRLVSRIAGEIRLRLDQYHIDHNQYPFAAFTPNGECIKGAIVGYIPRMDADFDCGGALAALPAWWLTHKWQEVTHYTYIPTTGISLIKFDSCASTFTFTWEPSLNRSKMQRSGPC